MQITGLLLKNNIQAKLIQSNEGFSLYNLSEVRYFLNQLNLKDDVFIINDDVWANAKRRLVSKFNSSSKLDIIKNIISDFEATNPKMKYKSDFEVFIRESEPEDFYSKNGEIIFISTIHKAKGKEFDNVFLMLENINFTSDETKRLLYVAITRAKRNLTIHLNSNFLDKLTTVNLERVENKENHSPPNELAMHLSLKNIWLDYSINKQYPISKLKSGDILMPVGDECQDCNGNSVLKFSKKFIKEIEDMKIKNYGLKSAKVNFIVYWKKEGTEKEVKIILPELYFESTIDT
jgi:ATP-dependent DNA helicase RecQ